MTNKEKILAFLKNSFLKTFSIIAMLALSLGLVYGISTLTTTSVPAEALVLCPNGTWNNVGCLNSYSCPNGWLISSTSCYEWVTTYSCPNGGGLSGASCIASAGSPVFVGDGCWAGGTYVASSPSTIFITGVGNTFFSYNDPNTLPGCFGPTAFPPAGTLPTLTGLTPIGTVVGYRAGYHTSGAYGAASSSGYVYRQEANPVYNNTGAVFIPESSDLTGIGCQTVTVGQLTTCTYSINNTSGLPTTLDYLSGELYVQGTPDTYLFDNTNSALDGSGNLVVSGIPTVGGTTGQALPVLTAIIDASTNTVGNLPVNKLPNLTLLSSTIDISDITNLKIQCGNNNFVIVPSNQTSTTTTCIGVIPSGKSLAGTTNLKLKIGNSSDIAGNLTSCAQDANPNTQINGNTSDNTFTCSNVPSGTMTAGQIIFGTVYETNATPPNYTDTLRKTNVYSADYYFDGQINFLKGVTGNTSAYNNVLHKDWRLGVSGNETRISLNNFKGYRDIIPGTTSSSQTNNGNLTNPSYICRIGVRPSGSSGNFINLVNDANSNGSIDSSETSLDIPYSTTNNNCQALFTNQRFTETVNSQSVSIGQPSITTNLAKIYNWETRIEVLDMSLATTPGNSSTAPVVATFNSGVGFKFAAIIPGG